MIGGHLRPTACKVSKNLLIKRPTISKTLLMVGKSNYCQGKWEGMSEAGGGA